MTKNDAFIELLAAGVSPDDAKELLNAITREPRPVRPRKISPDPLPHQPVWALMNRPFGIAAGFKQMFACERSENFDINDWEGTMP